MKNSIKTILGLDIGTNSIGWALVRQDFPNKTGEILGMGSRVIPMSQDIMSDFGKGNKISQTAERTGYRSVRRLRERHLLRRERLHRVLYEMNFLPPHYAAQIDFDQNPGKFKADLEPKLAYDRSSFIFKDSFLEMLNDFKIHQPQLLKKENGEDRLIPYDWTIYYLRKKALSQKIDKGELAWILLNFNRKRGYYQLRGEEEEDHPNKEVSLHTLKVISVTADEPQKGKKDIWYNLHLENGWVYRRSGKTPFFDWEGKTRDFIVTTEKNYDGTYKTTKEGEIKRSFRAPGEADWTLAKKKTEHEIEKSNESVGTFIYNHLLKDPSQKIRGGLITTIERKYYKEELTDIINKQSEFHPELKDHHLYLQCVRELYPNNTTHQQSIEQRGFAHLLIDDIIFYQRPLRSQISSISNCPLEFRYFRDHDGNIQTQSVKVIAKSNPVYQEFRIWQWMYNLAIYTRDGDINVTGDFLSSIEDKERLFSFLNNLKEVDQKTLLRFLLGLKGHKGKALNNEAERFRWNYVEDKTYPCNETRAAILNRLEKVDHLGADFLNEQIEKHLWHIIYSVNDKKEYLQALRSFAAKYGLDVESFVEAFKKFPPFKGDYGAYSEKAIKKLLPLMRLGKYWNGNDIDQSTKKRISYILSGEYNEDIRNRVREKSMHLAAESDFNGLPLWLAQYIVYDRHSEAADISKWNTADELDGYIRLFKQHSLRNPIVEQIMTETLRVVRDIWKHFGGGTKDFFDEIHIELGRDLKNSAEERKRISDKINGNENTNIRIKALLAELSESGDVNVRPYSPMHQEILKIYEEGALGGNEVVDEEILKISRTAQPAAADLRKYKLWLEQKYVSPYTGRIIPLSKLFTPEYEIEHIIPQSRYYDDSMSNKVICESAINKIKDNQIGLAFIRKHGGQIVTAGGQNLKILKHDDYEDFIRRNFNNNPGKRKKMMLEEIPETMIERQKNDMRFISKFITSILSNIVRAETNDDGFNSKNIIPVTGKITSALRQDWGLNGVWNELILPRFYRMNTLTNSNDFISISQKHNKEIPTVPIEHSRNFSSKRIDHRHHALDALVIACATRSHVNLLNNENAASGVRYDLRPLRTYKQVIYTHPHTGQQVEREIPKEFIKPWEHFTTEARDNLQEIVVSFKKNTRVINRSVNYYEKWVNKDGVLVKEKVKQAGKNWAIRKPLHKETVYGKVQLQGVKMAKGKVLTATRKAVDTSFNEKTIHAVTDSGIRKILLNYLRAKGSNPEVAFSPEGLEDMNNNISQYNDGKNHQPIIKVRIYKEGTKYPVGYKGNNTAKFVTASEGTNLFFAVYQDEQGNRSYESIPLNIVIENQKLGAKLKLTPEIASVPQENDKGHKLLFYLNPNDLVYVPEETPDHEKEPISKTELAGRIYKVVSFTGNQAFFIKANVANSIVNKIEFSALNKMERSIDGTMIKNVCLKIEVDRLGNVTRIVGRALPQALANISADPAGNYSRKIGMAGSFDELADLDARTAAFRSATDNHVIANELNRQIYSDELKQPMEKKIRFKKE